VARARGRVRRRIGVRTRTGRSYGVGGRHDEHGTFDWEYDVEAEVLYLSQGDPREAIGVDASEGLIFRYDVATERLVGLTIVGVRRRLAQKSAGS